MRLKSLDVLKAIAIIVVVLYHSGFMSFGYLGVDLFLVINGYLITKGLSKRILTPNASNVCKQYVDFEISRVVRLLPILLLAGIFCMALGYWVMLPDDYENLAESVVATNIFGNNILAAITTANYWNVGNAYKPLMHTWYVGLLMQFYIVYPILFFIARQDKRNPQQTLLVLLSIFATISLLIYFSTTKTALRFYYLPSRFFEFAAGGIVALTMKPQHEDKIFNDWFVYLCYGLLIFLFVVEVNFIPGNIKLVMVVLLSVVLIMSLDSLENKITANEVLASIGAASYSIFVWHQILLAFYRYAISSEFSVSTYILYLAVVGLLSYLTYEYVEQRTTQWIESRQSLRIFYVSIVILFLALTSFAGYIYMKVGVVRDVPELYINKNNVRRGLHQEYCDRIYKLDKPFTSDKPHWLVIGNSFGRDFANVILESSIADRVEVSYIYHSDVTKTEYSTRFAEADKVWFSTLGINEKIIMEWEVVCAANGVSAENIVIVGEKDFGESNGQFYVHRNSPDYFEQRTKVAPEFLEKNNRLKKLYGNRYLDLFEMVIDDKGTVPVFTPDHHYISQDCEHFSKGGAVWFAQLIDWTKYIE